MPGRTFFHRAARASRAFPAMEQDGCSTTASPRHHHRHICRVHFPPSHDGTHAASLRQLLYLPPLAVRGTYTHAACSWRCHTHAILPHLASSLDPPPSSFNASIHLMLSHLRS
ncbi:hypothetical protein IG631_22309 [Alternaria alternata]|nr:hypothetical protein IG631_22309 [Alternaria alternata]